MSMMDRRALPAQGQQAMQAGASPATMPLDLTGTAGAGGGPLGVSPGGLVAGDRMRNLQNQFAATSMAAQNFNYGLQPAMEGQQAQFSPTTGLDQQLAMMRQQRQALAQNELIGFDYDAQQAGAANRNAVALQAGIGADQQRAAEATGGSNLDQLAQKLANQYGLPVGRGELVDENGNWLITPDRLAQLSGGSLTMGDAAAKMQYIENALTRQQNREQQAKARGAITAGMELVGSRARGSLALMQSGFYQDLADIYANQVEVAEDKSYWIHREQTDIQQELQRRAERLFKKQSQMMAIMGLGNLVGGLLSKNPGLAAQGAGQIGAGGHGAGWW